MKFIFMPVSLAAGVLAGQISKKLFDFAWSAVKDEEAPRPRHRELPYIELTVALLVEGAIARLVRGYVDHGARLLDVGPDLLGRPVYRRPCCARAFVHWTSSFTLSTDCSGIGGVACWTFFLPVSAITPAIAAHTTATISAASQVAIAVASAAMAAAVSAPRA